MAQEIFPGELDGWRDLEQKVCQLFTELGCSATRGTRLRVARGYVDVDVVVRDRTRQPHSLVLCECKHWGRPVSKSVVHAFRTVVHDAGANQGFIISDSGFQSGAYGAAANTNVHLVAWREFQALMFDRWFATMEAKLARLAEDISAISDTSHDRSVTLMEHAIDKGSDPDAYEAFDALDRRYIQYKFCAPSHGREPVRSFPHWGTDPRQPVQTGMWFQSPREFFDVMLACSRQAFEDYARFILDRNAGVMGEAGVFDDTRLSQLRLGETTYLEALAILGRRTWTNSPPKAALLTAWASQTIFDLSRRKVRKPPRVKSRRVAIEFDEAGVISDLRVEDAEYDWQASYPLCID